MEFSDEVYTVFTAEIESGRTPLISVPRRELRLGGLESGETYRIAVLPPMDSSESTEERPKSTQQRRRDQSQPPVEEGETREVEIESMGDKGDGVAKIGPGYVIFVPETDLGDQVEIEITEARENFAFGEVLEDEPLSG